MGGFFFTAALRQNGWADKQLIPLRHMPSGALAFFIETFKTPLRRTVSCAATATPQVLLLLCTHPPSSVVRHIRPSRRLRQASLSSLHFALPACSPLT